MMSDGTATKIASKAICRRHSTFGLSRGTGAVMVRVVATSTKQQMAYAAMCAAIWRARRILCGLPSSVAMKST